MPELPEIELLSRHVNRSLKGRIVKKVRLFQPKCSNVSQAAWNRQVVGAAILKAEPHGKWVKVRLSNGGTILVNLGMGCDLLLVPQEKLDEVKHQADIVFDNGKALRFKFWWFGYLHYARPKALSSHPMVSKLGPHAFGSRFKVETLKQAVHKRKGGVKALLLNQQRLAGIGNAYVHDILFEARLHPFRAVDSLTGDDIERLHGAITGVFGLSIKLGGAYWEKNIYGRRGRFGPEHLKVGYREDKPCPVCAEPIVRMKTGGTTGFHCPSCQKL